MNFLYLNREHPLPISLNMREAMSSQRPTKLDDMSPCTHHPLRFLFIFSMDSQ